MDSEESINFAFELLNDSKLRTKLREKISQIKKLEELGDSAIRNLRITCLTTEPQIVVFYNGTASAELYPNVKSKLIKKGVISKKDVLSTDVLWKGKRWEYEHIVLEFPGSSIQVVLDINNPNYSE